MENPYFSVIIPTYNRSAFCVEAIDSILNQTFTEFEVIVCDDGSTDDTKKQVLACRDPRVKYFKQDNQGVSVARNLGVSKSKGRFICYLDSDDLWGRTKLEETHAFSLEHPELEVLFHDFCKHDIRRQAPYNATNTELFPQLFKYFTPITTDRLSWKSTTPECFKNVLEGYPFYPS